MDKNTITGLVLIFVILVTFSYFNKPSQSDIEALKRQHDSIALVEKENARQAEITTKAAEVALQTKATNNPADSAGIIGAENELKNLYVKILIKSFRKALTSF